MYLAVIGLLRRVAVLEEALVHLEVVEPKRGRLLEGSFSFLSCLLVN